MKSVIAITACTQRIDENVNAGITNGSNTQRRRNAMSYNSRNIVFGLGAMVIILGAAALPASDAAAQSSPPKVTPKVTLPTSLKTKDQVRREERALNHAPKPFQPKPPCLSC